MFNLVNGSHCSNSTSRTVRLQYLCPTVSSQVVNVDLWRSEGFYSYTHDRAATVILKCPYVQHTRSYYLAQSSSSRSTVTNIVHHENELRTPLDDGSDRHEAMILHCFLRRDLFHDMR